MQWFRRLGWISRVVAWEVVGAAVPVVVALLCLGRPEVGSAGEVRVAVAAHFAGAFEQLAADFSSRTGHVVRTSTGSTGKFLMQIRHGAPFDLLLAADTVTPQRLMETGWGRPNDRWTYAQGRLVLWSARGLPLHDGRVLAQSRIRHVAWSEPKLSPYGAAAVETLKAIGLYDTVQPRAVVGENVAHAFQFVATGHADVGFVALAQVRKPPTGVPGTWWLVPARMHAPLRHDALLRRDPRDPVAAQALRAYLNSSAARRIIQAHGYEVP